MQEPKIIRKLFLSGDVSEKKVDELTKGIVQINAFDEMMDVKNPDPINLYINTPGGLAYGGLSLISHMKESKAPIRGIVTGTAHSMGFIILCCCDKRLAYSHSKLMYHSLAYGLQGKLYLHEQRVKINRSLMKTLENKVLEKTRLPKDKIRELGRSGEDWFLSPEEALKFKVIHRIL